MAIEAQASGYVEAHDIEMGSRVNEYNGTITHKRPLILSVSPNSF